MSGHSPGCPVAIAENLITERIPGCRRCAARRMLHDLDDLQDRMPFGLFLDIQQRDVPELSLVEIGEVWDGFITACDEMMLEPHMCLEKVNR